MNHTMPEAIVTGYEQRINELTLPDSGDRHVLAAALHGRASVIVTFNLRHFPASALAQYHIQAQHPDPFLMEVVGGQIEEFLIMTRRHRARLRHHPKSAGEYIATLRQNQLAKIADVLDEHK